MLCCLASSSNSVCALEWHWWLLASNSGLGTCRISICSLVHVLQTIMSVQKVKLWESDAASSSVTLRPTCDTS